LLLLLLLLLLLGAQLHSPFRFSDKLLGRAMTTTL